jgi:hypothetical protein
MGYLKLNKIGPVVVFYAFGPVGFGPVVGINGLGQLSLFIPLGQLSA